MKIRCVSLLLLLAGCTPTTPYKAPGEGPRAQIRSELSTHDTYNEWLSVSVSTEDTCLEGRAGTPGEHAELFTVQGGTSRPAGYREIAANQPLHLVVTGLASAGRRCVIEFSTPFADNGRYLLKGGITDTDSGRCHVEVVNADTGASVAQFETPTQVPPAATQSYAWRRMVSHQGCYLR